jgi:hypothetical protein
VCLLSLLAVAAVVLRPVVAQVLVVAAGRCDI